MLKSIPKSNIARRSFQVYKKWDTSNVENSAITASAELGSENYSLYKSIQNKYYTDHGVINQFGSLNNPATFYEERYLPDTLYIVQIDQAKFGEKIKPGSVYMTDTNGVEILDDGRGSLVQEDPSYEIGSIDLQNESLIISQSSETYDIPLNPSIGLADNQDVDKAIDIEKGFLKVIDNGVPETYTILSIDLDSGIMILTEALDIEEIGLNRVEIGNIFYSDGLLIINGNTTDLTTFTLEYRSTKTIYETEVLITARAGEFNYSQNPTAVDVVLSDSYEFETTEIKNSTPAGTKKIKEILDITRREEYYGSTGSVTGSWDDYFEYSSTDKTGSYLAPYITTIGLYDDIGNMVAVAKLPQPIKNLPDYDVNFIVRFDT